MGGNDDTTQSKRGFRTFIFGITAMVVGFLSMSVNDVIDTGNYTVMYRPNLLFFLTGLFVYFSGVIVICHLILTIEKSPNVGENNLPVTRRIMRKKYSNSDFKHIGKSLIEIGLIITAIGILGSPFLMLFISSYIMPVIGRPQISYIPALIIIILGAIVLVYGLWIKYLSLVNEERNLSNTQRHSEIRSWHLSTGNLSALDSLSDRRDLLEIIKSKRLIRSLMIIIVLIAVITLNPLISPIDGIHDSDLDRYADIVDTYPNDPRLWERVDPISLILETRENSTDWLIIITHINATHQVDTREISALLYDLENGVSPPPLSFYEISSSYLEGMHFVDTVPYGYVNIGDEIALQKNAFGKHLEIYLRDSTGIIHFGSTTIQ
jgi:hypothetical protein